MIPKRVDRKRVLKHPYWTRQEWESEKHFTAFTVFRETPVEKKRSLADVVERIAKEPYNIQVHLRNIQHWHRNDMWARRALAYDRHLDAKRMRQIERRTTEMYERQSVIAVAMQQLIAERLKTLDPDQLTARDLKEWLEVSSRVELRARGQASETVRHEHYDGRDAIIQSANEFYKKMGLESPGMSERDKAAIVKESFGVEPHELGLPPEILTPVVDGGEAVN